jgi:hypothetical protein
MSINTGCIFNSLSLQVAHGHVLVGTRDDWRVLDRMIGFIDTSDAISVNYNQYSTIANLHSFQFTVAYSLGFLVSTGRLLATEFSTSNIKYSLNYPLPISLSYSTYKETLSHHRLTSDSSSIFSLCMPLYSHSSNKFHFTSSNHTEKSKLYTFSCAVRMNSGAKLWCLLSVGLYDI